MGAENRGADAGARFRLSLNGPLGLESPSGERVIIGSKRGQALLALLATSERFERSRGWLETMLWCDRSPDQAKASLRKELSNLRKLLNSDAITLLDADYSRVWLDPDYLRVDIRNGDGHSRAQFLEGLDIAGEDAFEDWLREERSVQASIASTPRPESPAFEPGIRRAKLAIAVLPIRMEPPAPELEFAVYGLGEELINRISRLRWLPVIARSSSFALGNDPIDPRTAGLALGARYVVEGTLRPTGCGYRFTINLVDADDGRSLWSDTLELEAIEDPSAIEAALEGITASLDHRVDQNEQRRAIAADENDRDLQQLIWKARWHLARLTDEDMCKAEAYLAQAEKLQPASAKVLIEKAWLSVRKLWLHRGSKDDIRSLRKAAQKAIFADPDDARGHMIAGIAEFWLQQPLRAESLLRRAVELNPSLVMAHAQLGSALHHQGKLDEAIEVLETAKRLSPNDFDLFFTEGELAMAHLAEGNCEKAIEHAEESLARRTAYWSSHVARINALVCLDRMTEASEAYAELMQAQPNFKPHFIGWLPYRDKRRNKALLDGLNQAASSGD